MSERFEAAGPEAKVMKVDEGLGLVFGWAIISTIKGEPYYDLQDDHIPETEMLAAAAEFMEWNRTAGDMHKEAEGGIILFAWPLTDEIAKAFEIETDKTGLMIAMKPATKEMLEKFKDGTYTGFSIGGSALPEDAPDG